MGNSAIRFFFPQPSEWDEFLHGGCLDNQRSPVPLPIFLLEDLQILTMKRKRGPAPHGKNVRIKHKETNEPDPVEDSDEEGNDFNDEEDSFKGISDDEQDHRQTLVSEEP